MEIKDEFYLFNTLPQVLRARGFRLYLSNNKRLVDLWLSGGAAILGHTPVNQLRELKNTASRGLYAPYPHFTENRLIKALLKLFPGRVFRLYAAPPQELKAAKLWRPYTDSQEIGDNVLIPVIPGIQTWRGGLPFGLCVAAAQSEEAASPLPPGDRLSPVLLSTAARGIHDILAAPERGKPHFPKITKALKTSKWQRNGIYLTLKETPAQTEWETLFNRFLETGFLLPPSPIYPVILPGEMSDGEEAKLAAVL
ncbi:MAG: hypothetical protein FWB77_04275 [Treponema sp.]|nr:hypothetical protein [Treponema sp.]